MADIVCLGEALIDLVPTVSGVGLAAAETFVKAAGGAPANVAAGVARLFVSAGFLGAVGDDGFGHFLADTLAAAGVALAGLRFTDTAPTAIAAVSLRADGDREFVFYGNPAAHMMYAPDDVDEAVIRQARILHFGSISLIGGPARAATLRAIDIAQANGVRVSFDPNLRLSLWPDAEAARAGMRLGLTKANIVKIGEEEVHFLQGDSCDTVEGARALWHPELELMAITRGTRGALWLDADTQGEEPGYKVAAIDTTGAGDAFMAGLLVGLVYHPEAINDHAMLGRVIRFANATGALTTTKRGAIPSIPDRAAVERFLAAQPI